jgi:hypothetical protein
LQHVSLFLEAKKNTESTAFLNSGEKMKNVIMIGLFALTNFLATNALAVIIEENGISYSCTPLSSSTPDNSNSCVSSCVKYCKQYDTWPFANRCLESASACGINVSVAEGCLEYDKWPFADRCLRQYDSVSMDKYCH